MKDNSQEEFEIKIIILKVIQYIFQFSEFTSFQNLIQNTTEKLQKYFEYKFVKTIIDHLEINCNKLEDILLGKIDISLIQKFDLKDLSFHRIINNSKIFINPNSNKLSFINKELTLQRINSIIDTFKSRSHELSVFLEESEENKFVKFSFLMAVSHIVFIDKSENRIITFKEFYNKHDFKNCSDFINLIYKSISEELDTGNILICDLNILEIFQYQLDDTEAKFENNKIRQFLEESGKNSPFSKNLVEQINEKINKISNEIKKKYNMLDTNEAKATPEILLNIIRDIFVKTQIYVGVNEIDALNMDQKVIQIRNHILINEKIKSSNFQIISFQDIKNGIYDYVIKKKNSIFSKEDLSKINVKTNEELQQNLFLLKERLEECKNASKSIIHLYTTKSPKVLYCKIPEIIKQIFDSNKISIVNSEKNYFENMAIYLGDKCNMNFSPESKIYLEFNSLMPYIISFFERYQIDFELLPLQILDVTNYEYSKTLQEFNKQIDKNQRQLESTLLLCCEKSTKISLQNLKEFIDYLFRVINMILIPKIMQKEKDINVEIIDFIREKIYHQFPNKDRGNVHIHLSTLIPILRLFIIEKTCSYISNVNSSKLGELLLRIKNVNHIQENSSDLDIFAKKILPGYASSERNIPDKRENFLKEYKAKLNEESKLHKEQKLNGERIYQKNNGGLDELILAIKETIRKYEMMVVDFTLKNYNTTEIEDLVETLRLYLKKLEIKKQEAKKNYESMPEKPIEEKKSKEVRIIEEIFQTYNLEIHLNNYSKKNEYYITQEIYLRFLLDFNITIKRNRALELFNKLSNNSEKIPLNMIEDMFIQIADEINQTNLLRIKSNLQKLECQEKEIRDSFLKNAELLFNFSESTIPKTKINSERKLLQVRSIKMKIELKNIEESRLIYERDKKILENKTQQDKISELLIFILNQKSERSNFFSMEQGFNKERKSVIKLKDLANEGKFELVERKMKLPIISTKSIPKFNLRMNNEQYYEPITIKNIKSFKLIKPYKMMMEKGKSLPSLNSNLTSYLPPIEIKTSLNNDKANNETEKNEINKSNEINTINLDNLNILKHHKRNFFLGTQNSYTLKKHLLLSIGTKRIKPKINLQKKITANNSLEDSSQLLIISKFPIENPSLNLINSMNSGNIKRKSISGVE